MKSLIYHAILFLCITTVWGQKEPYYKTYNWSDNPIEDIDIEKFKDKDIVAFKDKVVNEFCFINEDEFVEYSLVHKLYWLNSNDNIEKYNKVYLPSSANSEVVKNKARVITKEGKIIELDDSKILTSEDEETKRVLKYYALEGIEKGGYIEYFFVVKRYPAYTGKRITLQSDFDKKNVDFELLAPSNLIFQIKTYNDLPDAVKDSTNTDKNHWKLQLKEVPALEKEEQAPYSAMSKYLIYKLHENANNPGNDIVSYRVGSQNIYKNLYEEIDNKLKVEINGFIKSIEGLDSEDETGKIRLLENYIKTNIYVAEVSREDLEDVSSILDKKVANERGILKLYLTLFNALEIKHQIVYTTDRREMKFDKDFEAYNFFQENLIYFPKQKLYMAPTRLESRLGFPPGYMTDNYGLFVKQVTLGGFTSAIGSIKYIQPVNYDKTNYNLIMNVSFDPDDLTVTKLKMDRTMDGYYAVYVQPFMDVAKEENKSEIIESVIKSINPNLEIIEKKVFNASSKDFGTKPLQILAELKSEDYVDKAGNKYLFKIGAIIGPQQEMYQEKVRQLPVENEFERSYDRKIIVDIPNGYQFKNLDKINIDESYSKDDKELFMFKSSYSIKDNQLIVSIKEQYNQNIVDVSLYEEYRTVINSAANFNKVTLVLEKL
ncbi:DUF3857 domain-containing protein [Aquimarina pacifica]|uniref:DUF3857 domain-containing protein n=1 Tax=Aquimarina pacifica TaxID=1296415 RepID=UPI000472A8A4|nr:DUF3857 domain-containing protein [Aquimarina pacifica]